MNKSLVLVMCDVLVLSAMSLSTGGFKSVKDTNASSTEEILVIDKTKNLWSETTNDLARVYKILGSLSNEFANATKELNTYSNNLTTATNQIVSLTNIATNQEITIRDLKDQNVAFTNQIDNLSKELANATKELNTCNTNLTTATNQIESLTNIATNQKIIIQSLKDQNVALTNQVDNLSKELANATNETAKYTEILNNKFRPGTELLNGCIYGIYVEENGVGKIHSYSPLISIGTNMYVITYMSEKVENFDKISILQSEKRKPLEVDSDFVYEFKTHKKQDTNIVLFRVKTTETLPAISLGMNKSTSLDYFYRFKATGESRGDFKEAKLVSADMINSLKDSFSIKQGDMLISGLNKAIVRMSANDEVIFNHIITEKDLNEIKITKDKK